VSGEDLMKGLARIAREEREPGAAAPSHPDLSRPIDDATRARFADAALRAMGTTRPARTVQRARPSVARIATAAAGVVALAAGALLLVRSPKTELLPSYEVSLVGGSSQTRAAPVHASGESVVVHADGYLEIRLRPAHPVGQELEARTAALHDGKPLPWTAPVERSTDGALRIAGPVSALFPEARGNWTVLVAIGRPGAVPLDPEAIARATPGDSLRVVRVTVDIQP
jgi:hypothetical protein